MAFPNDAETLNDKDRFYFNRMDEMMKLKEERERMRKEMFTMVMKLRKLLKRCSQDPSDLSDLVSHIAMIYSNATHHEFALEMIDLGAAKTKSEFYRERYYNLMRSYSHVINKLATKEFRKYPELVRTALRLIPTYESISYVKTHPSFAYGHESVVKFSRILGDRILG
jgi:hypothetical protein